MRKIRTFSKYTKEAYKTATFKGTDLGQNTIPPIAYCALGLAGESGEVVDQVKKLYRNEKGVLTPERLEKLKLELGDQFWYWSMLVKELGLTPEEVVTANINKLQLRLREGTIKDRHPLKVAARLANKKLRLVRKVATDVDKGTTSRTSTSTRKQSSKPAANRR
jgi:NTP pyrophosphatase (non-canonical NTP hydrolase)